jgi:hypothetical protein
MPGMSTVMVFDPTKGLQATIATSPAPEASNLPGYFEFSTNDSAERLIGDLARRGAVHPTVITWSPPGLGANVRFLHHICAAASLPRGPCGLHVCFLALSCLDIHLILNSCIRHKTYRQTITYKHPMLITTQTQTRTHTHLTATGLLSPGNLQ